MSITNLDQILDDDLFVVTDGDNGHKSVTGAQVKTLFGPPPPKPWDGHDGGVFHVLNATGKVELQGYSQPYTAWTIDGTPLGEIDSFDVGDNIVFTTDDIWTQNLFENNKNVDWHFGEETNTSLIEEVAGMFTNCQQFTGVGIEYFDVSNVLWYDHAFNSCYEFNGDISGWDVSSAQGPSNFAYFLYWCHKFDHDLSNWCVEKIIYTPDQWDTNTDAWSDDKKPKWGQAC